MEPTRDEPLPISDAPVPRHAGDLLATTTSWLALVGIATMLAGWLLAPGGTHGGEEKLRAHGLMTIGGGFAMAAVVCALPVLCWMDRSTRFAKLAIGLSIVGLLLILLTPAI